MLFHCVRQQTAAVAQIVVSDDTTTYLLDPAHFTEAFAAALAVILAGVAVHWTRRDTPAPQDCAFRIELSHVLPASIPVTCLDEPGRYGYLFNAAHVTERGRAALDAAAREELRYWSQGASPDA